MNTRYRRVLRGGLVAAVSTYIALFSHVLGGGHIPTVLGVAAALILSFFAATFLLRSRSLPRLLLVVCLSQVVFHQIFAVGGTGASGGGGAHQHTVFIPLPDASVLADAAGNASMWLSHLLAALITTAILFRGEQVIHTLSHGLVAGIDFLLYAIRGIQGSVPRSAVVFATEVSTLLGRIFSDNPRTRGPPTERVTTLCS